MSRARVPRWAALILAVAAGIAAGVIAFTDDDTSTDASSVSVFGPYVDADADRFAEVLDDFEAATGIQVAYTGSIDFVSDIRQRAVGNQRPDVAIVPQPGVVDALIEAEVLRPLQPATVQVVRDSFPAAALAATPWNLEFAVPYRSNVKSLVWYRPDIFEQNGWAVPETLDELETLIRRIEADGAMAPWCFSIFAGSATGWPATDWVEDIVLREAGVDVYERWAGGELSWQSPEIEDAFVAFRETVVDSERSAGGRRAILQTEVADAGAPLFTDEPGCAMYKQASFAEDWFPNGTSIGPDADVDYFALPGTTATDRLLITAGDAAVAFDDRPSVERLMEFLASADGGRAWADGGGFVSQRTDVDVDAYYDDQADARLAVLLQEQSTTRFDASDTLPAAVGSDLLWRQITAWLGGSLTLDNLLVSIDEALEIES